MAIITRAGVLCEKKSPIDELKEIFRQLISNDSTDKNEKSRQDMLEAEIKSSIKEVYTVPYDAEVYNAQISGIPLTLLSSDSPAAIKYEQISEKIKKW